MPMASVCARARGTLQLQASTVSATRNAVSKICKPNSSPLLEGGPSKFVGLASSRKPKSATRFSLQGLFNSRIPVELGCAESLMPLHCATASALFTSLLSVQSRSWGSLSEGFATPL